MCLFHLWRIHFFSAIGFWAGENNASEIQCKVLKMQVSFLCQINYLKRKYSLNHFVENSQ